MQLSDSLFHLHQKICPDDVSHVNPSISAALYQQFQQPPQQSAHIGGIAQSSASPSSRVRESEDVRFIRSTSASHSNGSADTRYDRIIFLYSDLSCSFSSLLNITYALIELNQRYCVLAE